MEEAYYIINCPHCLEEIIIHKNDVNCGIFRHGVYKNNLQPIPPHSNKEDCEYLLKNGEIYGCSKPFRVVKRNNEDFLDVFQCEYI